MPDQSPTPITRRRVLTILAGASAALMAGPAQSARLHEWRGTALGAEARIVLAHADRTVAGQTLALIRTEIERLESIFSLYRADSAVSMLNRTGRLRAAPLELVHLTRRALAITRLTDGAFDVTVQPLWDLYGGHFRKHPSDTVGPPEAAIVATRKLIGPDMVRVSGTGIQLAPGTQLTFNGIAQGYITDRITALIRAHGWHDVLINIGEYRALGTHPDGRPWKIGLPGGVKTLLSDAALATSEGTATRFTAAAPHHHLFDPRTGLCASGCSTLSIVASNAADADALSTALFIAPPSEHQRILSFFPGAHRVSIG